MRISTLTMIVVILILCCSKSLAWPVYQEPGAFPGADPLSPQGFQQDAGVPQGFPAPEEGRQAVGGYNTGPLLPAGQAYAPNMAGPAPNLNTQQFPSLGTGQGQEPEGLNLPQFNADEPAYQQPSPFMPQYGHEQAVNSQYGTQDPGREQYNTFHNAQQHQEPHWEQTQQGQEQGQFTNFQNEQQVQESPVGQFPTYQNIPQGQELDLGQSNTFQNQLHGQESQAGQFPTLPNPEEVQESRGEQFPTFHEEQPQGRESQANQFPTFQNMQQDQDQSMFNPLGQDFVPHQSLGAYNPGYQDGFNEKQLETQNSPIEAEGITEGGQADTYNAPAAEEEGQGQYGYFNQLGINEEIGHKHQEEQMDASSDRQGTVEQNEDTDVGGMGAGMTSGVGGPMPAGDNLPSGIPVRVEQSGFGQDQAGLTGEQDQFQGPIGQYQTGGAMEIDPSQTQFGEGNAPDMNREIDQNQGQFGDFQQGISENDQFGDQGEAKTYEDDKYNLDAAQQGPFGQQVPVEEGKEGTEKTGFEGSLDEDGMQGGPMAVRNNPAVGVPAEEVEEQGLQDPWEKQGDQIEDGATAADQNGVNTGKSSQDGGQTEDYVSSGTTNSNSDTYVTEEGTVITSTASPESASQFSGIFSRIKTAFEAVKSSMPTKKEKEASYSGVTDLTSVTQNFINSESIENISLDGNGTFENITDERDNSTYYENGENATNILSEDYNQRKIISKIPSGFMAKKGLNLTTSENDNKVNVLITSTPGVEISTSGYSQIVVEEEGGEYEEGGVIGSLMSDDESNITMIPGAGMTGELPEEKPASGFSSLVSKFWGQAEAKQEEILEDEEESREVTKTDEGLTGQKGPDQTLVGVDAMGNKLNPELFSKLYNEYKQGKAAPSVDVKTLQQQLPSGQYSEDNTIPTQDTESEYTALNQLNPLKKPTATDQQAFTENSPFNLYQQKGSPLKEIPAAPTGTMEKQPSEISPFKMGNEEEDEDFDKNDEDEFDEQDLEEELAEELEKEEEEDEESSQSWFKGWFGGDADEDDDYESSEEYDDYEESEEEEDEDIRQREEEYEREQLQKEIEEELEEEEEEERKLEEEEEEEERRLEEEEEKLEKLYRMNSDQGTAQMGDDDEDYGSEEEQFMGDEGGIQRTDTSASRYPQQPQSHVALDNDEEDIDESPGSGHFIAYFFTAVVFVIIGYLVYHNKQKVLAFVLEGRNSRRRRSTGSSGPEYKKLTNTVGDMSPGAMEKGGASQGNFIY